MLFLCGGPTSEIEHVPQAQEGRILASLAVGIRTIAWGYRQIQHTSPDQLSSGETPADFLSSTVTASNIVSWSGFFIFHFFSFFHLCFIFFSFWVEHCQCCFSKLVWVFSSLLLLLLFLSFFL